MGNVTAIAAGMNHDIALKSDGTVAVWGCDTNDDWVSVPPGLSNVTAVAAGWTHNAVLLADGTVGAWGYNGATDGWHVTDVPAGLSNVTAIAAGANHTLALKQDGTVAAWGAGNGTDEVPWANHGQSIVPAGLSNVVAIAAWGYHSMALRSDQTVVVWGDLDEPPPGLGGVTAIASGHEHGLALRSGLLLPFIVQQPNSQYAWPGANLTLRVAAIALGDLTYQWQFNGVNISAATGTALAVANMQPSREGPYRVIVSNAAGSVTSSVAELALARPQIVSTTPPAPSTKSINTNFQMSVTVTVPLSSRQHPLGYQWFHDGAPIAGATNNYLWLYPPWTPPWQTNPVEGDYTVAVGNDAGTNQAGPWTIHYVSPLIPGAPAMGTG